MSEYVCGFMFSDDYRFVGLIKKKKPAYQAGKMNGIGGKIEEVGHANTADERPLYEEPGHAMAREFQEETGVLTHPNEWTLFRSERFVNGIVVHFMWAKSSEKLDQIRTMEAEEVVKEPVTWLRTNPQHYMYNLPYLIEMAIALSQQPPEFVPEP